MWTARDDGSLHLPNPQHPQQCARSGISIPPTSACICVNYIVKPVNCLTKPRNGAYKDSAVLNMCIGMPSRLPFIGNRMPRNSGLSSSVFATASTVPMLLDKPQTLSYGTAHH